MAKSKRKNTYTYDDDKITSRDLVNSVIDAQERHKRLVDEVLRRNWGINNDPKEKDLDIVGAH